MLVATFFFAVPISIGDYQIFLRGDVSLNYTCFRNFWTYKLPSSELSNAGSLSEVLLVRDGDLLLDNFNCDEVDSVIVATATH